MTRSQTAADQEQRDFCFEFDGVFGSGHVGKIWSEPRGWSFQALHDPVSRVPRAGKRVTARCSPASVPPREAYSFVEGNFGVILAFQCDTPERGGPTGSALAPAVRNALHVRQNFLGREHSDEDIRICPRTSEPCCLRGFFLRPQGTFRGGQAYRPAPRKGVPRTTRSPQALRAESLLLLARVSLCEAGSPQDRRADPSRPRTRIAFVSALGVFATGSMDSPRCVGLFPRRLQYRR